MNWFGGMGAAEYIKVLRSFGLGSFSAAVSGRQRDINFNGSLSRCRHLYKSRFLSLFANYSPTISVALTPCFTGRKGRAQPKPEKIPPEYPARPLRSGASRSLANPLFYMTSTYSFLSGNSQRNSISSPLLMYKVTNLELRGSARGECNRITPNPFQRRIMLSPLRIFSMVPSAFNSVIAWLIFGIRSFAGDFLEIPIYTTV